MKKLLSLLLALAMVLSAVPALAEALPVEDDAALPQIGDVVNGFEALEIRPFPMIGADVVLFEHQKTGAKQTYVANEDNNRVFQLVFLTRPIDDTGLPHVFEHSTLSGSEKYPSANLFMNLAYQTYNTYMNAYTMDAMTSYPIASLSEAQLLKYADYYTDSCLHPSVLENERIYRTEAWRYRLADKDDELTLEGTVYSEMLGATNLARAALLNANKVTFPGAALAFDQGGMPDAIPDMTFESLKNYHSLFYHPSNCMAYLYGQFEDYTAFLALLDEAFAGYEKAEFHYEDAAYAPITAPVESKVGFPMAEGTDPANQSQIYYYILCPGMKGNVEQELVIDNLCTLLDEDASILKQNLKKALPTGSFSVGREVAAPDDAIVFVAANVNEDDAPLFKQTVDASLKELAENGFAKDMLDSAVAALELSIKLAPETADPVQGILESLAYSYATSGDPFHYLDSVASIDNMTQWNEDGTFQAAASQWLVEPALYTLTTTYPQPGQKEIHDAALAEYLAQVKANMTEEELQAVIDFTNAEPEEDDASAMVAQLQAVTVESLPEEVRAYDVIDETDENGIRHIDAVAGVDGVGMVSLYLDAAALPQEAIHWMRLYTRLLGQLDTDTHTKEELDVLCTRYLYNKTIGVDVSGKGENYHPYLFLGWTAMDEDLAAGYDLMNEIVFRTQFTDTQKLLEKVQAQKASVRNTINGSPYNVSLYRAMAVDSPLYRYYNYLNYLDYYSFLENVETMLAENPDEAVRQFQILQGFFANNAGAIAGFAGSEESIQVNRPLADAFLGRLDHQPHEPMAYDLPVPAAREAMIADVNVQFNNVIASYKALGLEGYDASLDAVTALVTDQFLIPILRDQYGVYSPWNGAFQSDDGGLYLITYRDPNVAETFEVYQALPEMIAQQEVEQDVLDGYILNSYASLAKGSGELTGANDAVDRTVSGLENKTLEYMRQLKTVTPEAVKAAAEIYQKLWDNGVHSTAGSASAINANADLYDVILNPFGAVDASEVELTDVTEGGEYYEAVRFVFENGLMAANYEDAFGVDDPATAGDLVGALYVMIGGTPNAPEEAIAYLGQFGIVPEGVTADTVITNGMSDEIFVNFGAAVGLPLEADAPNETTDQPITRGALAEQIQMLAMYLQ
ncbi:MAG: insulinase family protein [Clostridia bacterium]|nr:insulinase family protein [Clostridia bacterium]